jgi:hypothetical protein
VAGYVRIALVQGFHSKLANACCPQDTRTHIVAAVRLNLCTALNFATIFDAIGVTMPVARARSRAASRAGRVQPAPADDVAPGKAAVVERGTSVLGGAAAAARTHIVPLLSLGGIPICWALNGRSGLQSDVALFGVALAICVAFVAVTSAWLLPRGKSGYYYMFAFFAFTCMVDAVLAATAHGLTRWGNFYLAEGEVYLRSNHGGFINWWDATAHYACYLAFTYWLAAGRSVGGDAAFRAVGCWWVGSIINSLIVFLPGGFIGRYGALVKPSYLLNVPYAAIPVAFAVRVLGQPAPAAGPVRGAAGAPLRQRPLDAAFALAFAAGALFCAFRALAALGAPAALFASYVARAEPYLADTTRYPLLQALLYFFYLVPFFLAAVVHAMRGGAAPRWLLDASVFAAGAVAQGQFAYLGGSLHDCGASCGDAAGWRPVPAAAWWPVLAANAALLLVPQAFALHLHGWSVGDLSAALRGQFGGKIA